MPISKPDFEGKEKYTLIDLVFKEHKDKSFSVDMLARALHTSNKESVQLVCDQMVIEEKIVGGPVIIDRLEINVYASSQAYTRCRS